MKALEQNNFDCGKVLRSPEIVNAINRFQSSINKNGNLKVHNLNLPKLVSDSTNKYILSDSKGILVGVLIISPKDRPCLIREAAERAFQIKQHLGKRIGSCVLLPSELGEFEGVSYSITAYHQPFSHNRLRRYWQLLRFREKALNWLKDASYITLVEPCEDSLLVDFINPLKTLLKHSFFSQCYRKVIFDALNELESKRWQPRLILAHYDLWTGNFLIRNGLTSSDYPFMIIDWAGARLKGHAIYDLVRLSLSSRQIQTKFLSELIDHAQILQCNIAQTQYYLFSALGYLAENLGEWPFVKFLETSKHCIDHLHFALSKADQKHL